MKVTIYIDGKPARLDIDQEGNVCYGAVSVGNVIKTEEGRWKAIDDQGKEWFYRKRKDALLNICFDCPDFWKESFRRIQEKHKMPYKEPNQ